MVKKALFSPTQPRRAKTRRSASKAAARGLSPFRSATVPVAVGNRDRHWLRQSQSP